MEAETADYAIARTSRLLRFATSGSYALRKSQVEGPGPQARARRESDAKVHKVHRESDEVNGAPRVAAQLEREGNQANEKIPAASMRRQGLEGGSPRRFRPLTTIAGVPTHHIPDLVKRKWDPGRINAVWISDITYLHTREGFVYLCALRDGHSRRVLGWAMDERQMTDLVERALRIAHTLRRMPPTDVVMHADRGSQYTSAQFHQVAVELQVRQPMGRTGVC